MAHDLPTTLAPTTTSIPAQAPTTANTIMPLKGSDLSSCPPTPSQDREQRQVGESQLSVQTQPFPFLRLIPELRNRIYKLVLGGNSIHIRYRWCHSERAEYRSNKSREAIDRDMSCPCDFTNPGVHKALHMICQMPETVEQAFLVSKQGRQERSTEPPIHPFRADYIVHPNSGHHPFCRNVMADPEHVREIFPRPHGYVAPISLVFYTALLRTCRQIHNEVALIPFADNMFVFQHIQEVLRFANTTLSTQQRDAIRSVYLTRDAARDRKVIEAALKVFPKLDEVGIDLALYPEYLVEGQRVVVRDVEAVKKQWQQDQAELPHLKAAKVIVDFDRGFPGALGREAKREIAELVESALTSAKAPLAASE